MKKVMLTRFVKLLILAAIVLLALLAGFYAGGPMLLERIITGQMRSNGLADPVVKVQAITHKSLHLTEVSARKPMVHIDSVIVYFSVGSLLQGMVDEIVINGLKGHVAFRDNKLDLGLPKSQSDSDTALAIPAQTIDVRSSSLILDFQEKNYHIPFSLLANFADDQRLTFSVWSRVLAQPFFIKGQSNLKTMETRVRARALWSEFLGPGRFFFRETEPDLEKSGAFQAGLDLYWEINSQGKGLGSVDIQVQAEDLRMWGIENGPGLEEGVFSARARFDDQLVFDQLEARLNLAGLSYNNNLLDHLELIISENGTSLELSSRLNRPVSASFRLHGKQSSINELLKDSPKYTADFEWQAGVEFLPAQLDFLSPVKVEADRSLTARGQGHLNAAYSPEAVSTEDIWFLQMSAKRLDFASAGFFLPVHGLKVRDLLLEAPFYIEAWPEQVKGSLSEQSSLSIKEIYLQSGSQRYQVKGLDFVNQPGNLPAQFEIMKSGSKNLSWHTRLNSGFDAFLKDADISGRDLSFSGELHEDEQGAFNADSRIKLEVDLARLKKIGAEIADISLDIPFVLGSATAGQGQFSTGGISYSGVNFPGISGQAAVENYQVKSRGSWPFLPGAELEFAVDMLVDPDKDVAGKINAHTKWFDIPEKEMLDAVASMPENMSIEGSARADFDLVIEGSGLRPQLRIDVRDADVREPDMDMEAAGISGSMLLNDFFPLTTPGNQRMEIQRIRIGQLELVDGFATFRLESPQRIFVEKTRWNLPEGGFIAAHAARVDLQDFNADFEVFFEDIDLVHLVSRISQEKVAGSGRVYGRVPLLYKQDKVTIGQGYLYSVPGTGRLSIKDEEWLDMLLLYVRQAMKDHPYLSTVSERLEQALRDFEYDFLSVNLEPGPDDTSARIELRGKGVQGDPPQEVGSLVVNVNDLQEIVNRVLHFQLTRDESVKKTLDDLLDFEQ
ncbi:MAG: YdbH domain-containing protein [Desulfonatronovibrio sp.]